MCIFVRHTCKTQLLLYASMTVSVFIFTVSLLSDKCPSFGEHDHCFVYTCAYVSRFYYQIYSPLCECMAVVSKHYTPKCSLISTHKYFVGWVHNCYLHSALMESIDMFLLVHMSFGVFIYFFVDRWNEIVFQSLYVLRELWMLMTWNLRYLFSHISWKNYERGQYFFFLLIFDSQL